jgi:hypothetical protein
MRLKQHRQDVKDLMLMNSDAIARRYLNLIRAMEALDKVNYIFDDANRWSVIGRVLKDAEE